ncbi:drug resistance transporter [Colletotrichum tofieldiae]|nr:drug resistance transporter [Colletotrichum tofieldiae]
MVVIFFPKNARPLTITRNTFASMDYLGMLLYLTASIMVVFALEEGGLFYRWNSTVIVASFIISGVGFVCFLIWEWVISKKQSVKSSTLPLFPMHLVKQRIISFSFLTALLAGFPFLVTIVFLPQRFQLINGFSPVEAGVRMLPLLLVSATGAALGGIFSKKYNISCYVLAVSLGLQVIGLGLMTTLPTASRKLPQAQYGFQVLLGLGFGLSLSCLVIVAQMEVRNDDDVGKWK